jgi:hypothetical protein
LEILDPFAPYYCRYSGVGDLTWGKHGKQTVSFEARQVPDGRIVIGFMALGPIDWDELRDWMFPMRLSGYVSEPDGAHLEADGLLPHYIRHYQGPLAVGRAYAFNTSVFYGSPEESAQQFTFTLTNCVLGGRHSEFESWARPIESLRPTDMILDGRFAVTLEPLPTYDDTVARLAATPGVEPTALCHISDPGSLVSASDAAALADDVCIALSLSTGTHINWISYEFGQRIVHVWMQESKRFSGAVCPLGWELDPAAVISAWRKSRRPDKSIIHYFLNAAAEYREHEWQTGSLLAATLLDVLTNQYGSVDGDPDIRPFRLRLTRLLNRYGLPTRLVDQIVRARNELVHEAGGAEDKGTYELLLGTAHALLARISGYAGPIRSIE